MAMKLEMTRTVRCDEVCETCKTPYHYAHVISASKSYDPDGPRTKAEITTELDEKLDKDTGSKAMFVTCPACRRLNKDGRVLRYFIAFSLLLGVFVLGWLMSFFMSLAMDSGVVFWLLIPVFGLGALACLFGFVTWPFGWYKDRTAKITTADDLPDNEAAQV